MCPLTRRNILMKRLILILTVILLSSNVYSKTANWEKYYLKGTKAIRNKKYEEGIKYLSMSIQAFPTANAYVNRAAAYSATGDTCGFCMDLKKAAELNDREAKDFYNALLQLETELECKNFLRDLLTEVEIKEFVNRWLVVRLLSQKVPYEEITLKTGMSSTTIARISKWLHNGTGGYKTLINRVSHKT